MGKSVAVLLVVAVAAMVVAAQSVDDLISQAQALIPTRYIMENLTKAIDLYEQALKLAPERADILTALTQLHYELAIATDDVKLKREALHRGADLGFKVLGLGDLAQAERTKLAAFQEVVSKSNNVAALYWTAKNWGTMVDMGGLSAKLGAIFRGMPGKVKALYERALAIDDTYFGGGPHEDYGALLASFTKFHLYGATLEEAKEHLDKAIEIASRVGYLVPYKTYAERYAVLVHDKALFENLLHHVLEAPIGDWPFWNRIAKRDAEELLAKEDKLF